MYGFSLNMPNSGAGTASMKAEFRIFASNKIRISLLIIYMGRNKFSQREIDIIARLLRKKNAGTRFQQKMIRHDLRVKFEFNISDFNVQGQAFGDQELYAAIERGAIQILDDATIAAMKERRAQKREAERLAREAEAAANPTPQDPNADWEAALKEWNDYYGEAEK